MSENELKQTEQIPMREKLAYGAGMLNFHLTNQGVYTLIYVIYNVVLGLDVAFIGLVVSLARLWDAFTDPFMGKISDNFRSRFGRRRPFILIGGILTAIFFVLFWHAPQEASSLVLKWYLVIASIFLFTAFTIFSVPYFGLGYEITPDEKQRAKIFAWREIIGRGAMFVIPWIFRFAQSEIFDSAIEGMRTISFVIGLVIITISCVTAFNTKERYYSKVASSQKQLSFLQSMKLALTNRNFMNIIAQFLCMIVGAGLVNVMGQYIIIYHIYGGNTVKAATLMGLGGTTYALSCLFSASFLVQPLVRLGRFRSIYILYGVVMLAALSKWFTFNPAFPYLVLLTQGVMGLADVSFWVLCSTLEADIIDDDEVRNHVRREGLFGAVTSWIKKLSISTLALLTGLLIAATGFDPQLGGNQSEGTILAMRIMFTLSPILFCSVGVVLMTRYRVKDDRVKANQAELARRHAETAE